MLKILFLIPLIIFGVTSCAAQPGNGYSRAQRALAECAQLPTPVDFNLFYQYYLQLADKTSWLTLVDAKHPLPKDYQPRDLVTVSPKIKLRKEALEQMNKMIQAARAEHIELRPISTYRTYAYQKMLADRKPGNPYVALPGESQHHLGTAVDFNTLEPEDENIPAIQWLFKHAGEYGFSLSFPKGPEAEKESGYPYEPWHFRYITREGVQFQDLFFEGNQHKTLAFLEKCPPERILLQIDPEKILTTHPVFKPTEMPTDKQ